MTRLYIASYRCTTSMQHGYYNIHNIRCYTSIIKTTTVNVFEVTILSFIYQAHIIIVLNSTLRPIK